MVELVQDAHTGKMLNASRCTQGFSIRPQIMGLIQKSIPTFGLDSWIVNWRLDELKLAYANTILGDKHLAMVVRQHDTLSDDVAKSLTLEVEVPTFVDKVAAFASSHKFGLFLISLVTLWVLFNFKDGFDVYPFNLLDLVLGIIASMQALFIMISQGKEAKKDKERMTNTLRLNLKNEYELAILREKIDHIIRVQNPEIYRQVRKK